MQRAGGAAMTDPITPPLEMLQQWASEYWGNPGECLGNGEKYIAAQSAQWGADQELEACCEWLDRRLFGRDEIAELRAARRPKLPSKAESALNALEHILRHSQTDHGANTIRLALERLKKLEALDD